MSSMSSSSGSPVAEDGGEERLAAPPPLPEPVRAGLLDEEEEVFGLRDRLEGTRGGTAAA